MSRNNIWGLWGGIALIGLGALFLLGQFFQINIMGLLWPMFIIGVGAAFFIGMAAGGRSMGALAVPGSVITSVGLILFLQNLTGLWATWAYAWALIIAAAGLGLIIFGSYSDQPDLRRAGRIVIGVGLALFFVFGLFFELGTGLLGVRSLSGIFWAMAAILVGLYLVFGRAYFASAGGPASRSSIAFGSQPFTPSATPTSRAEFSASPEAQPAAMIETADTPGVQAAPSTTNDQGIRRLRFHGLGDMTILQGEREGLEIEASEAVKERIRADVHGDTLEIRYEQDWLDWLNPRFWNISPIRYTLYVRDLVQLDAAGLGNLVIPSLSTAHVDIDHSGTGNVTVRKLAAETVVIHQGGLGNVEVEGRVGRQEVELSGTGSYHAGRLESRAASIRLSGLGSASVRVDETLDASVSGLGSIDYYGNPRISQQVSGLGSVRRVGGR